MNTNTKMSVLYSRDEIDSTVKKLAIKIKRYYSDKNPESVRHAAFWGATWRGFTVPGVYLQVAVRIGRACPALVLALPVALVTYAVWPRTRYFGNTAPLLVAVLFFALGMAHPDLAGAGFLLAAIPFLFIFVAGVLADLLETQYRPLVAACIVALLITYVARTLLALAQVPQG